MFASLVSVLVLTAGIASIGVLVTLALHDLLRRAHQDLLAIDTVFAKLFGLESEERAHHGVSGLFLVAWGVVIAFAILRQSVVFVALTNPVLESVLFGGGVYLVITLLFLPVFGLGAFGAKHHPHVPYWAAFFTAVFVLVIATLFGVVS